MRIMSQGRPRPLPGPHCTPAGPSPRGLPFSLLTTWSGFQFVLEKVTDLCSSPGGNGPQAPHEAIPLRTRTCGHLRPVIVSAEHCLRTGLLVFH